MSSRLSIPSWCDKPSIPYGERCLAYHYPLRHNIHRWYFHSVSKTAFVSVLEYRTCSCLPAWKIHANEENALPTTWILHSLIVIHRLWQTHCESLSWMEWSRTQICWTSHPQLSAWDDIPVLAYQPRLRICVDCQHRRTLCPWRGLPLMVHDDMPSAIHPNSCQSPISKFGLMCLLRFQTESRCHHFPLQYVWMHLRCCWLVQWASL